jgi:hypothetical protein
MTQNPPGRPKRESVAESVDRLLRKLPGADPTLRGDRDPVRPAPPPRFATGAGLPPRGIPGTARPGGPTARDRGVAWLLVIGGAAFGVAMTQWPYAHTCGVGLYVYLTAVFAVMVVGGWGALAAWKTRIATAHIIALLVAFWGIVLAAEQVLPRIGYAEARATWRCPS